MDFLELAEKRFSFTDKNRGTKTIKIVGFIISIIGGIIKHYEYARTIQMPYLREEDNNHTEFIFRKEIDLYVVSSNIQESRL